VEGAHLAIINSDAEARLLQLIFSRHPKITGSNHNDYAYVGVHDMIAEGQFTTIFGKNVPCVLYQSLLTSGLFSSKFFHRNFTSQTSAVCLVTAFTDSHIPGQLCCQLYVSFAIAIPLPASRDIGVYSGRSKVSNARSDFK
jgi:hypothetical protein